MAISANPAGGSRSDRQGQRMQLDRKTILLALLCVYKGEYPALIYPSGPGRGH